MIKFFFVLVVMWIGYYFRKRYEKKHFLPVLADNKQLATLSKITFGFVTLAVLGIFFKLIKVSLILLILLIPIVLYLNFKIYYSSKIKNRDDKPKIKSEKYD